MARTQTRSGFGGCSGFTASKCLGGEANTRGVTGVSGRGRGGALGAFQGVWGVVVSCALPHRVFRAGDKTAARLKGGHRTQQFACFPTSIQSNSHTTHCNGHRPVRPLSHRRGLRDEGAGPAAGKGLSAVDPPAAVPLILYVSRPLMPLCSIAWHATRGPTSLPPPPPPSPSAPPPSPLTLSPPPPLPAPPPAPRISPPAPRRRCWGSF